MRLRNHYEVDGMFRLIGDSMLNTGRDFHSLLRREHFSFLSNLHCHRAGEDEKELSGPIVKVSLLGRACRHSFMDHAELRGIDELPAIATLSPHIMLCVVLAHHELTSFTVTPRDLPGGTCSWIRSRPNSSVLSTSSLKPSPAPVIRNGNAQGKLPTERCGGRSGCSGFPQPDTVHYSH